MHISVHLYNHILILSRSESQWKADKASITKGNRQNDDH